MCQIRTLNAKVATKIRLGHIDMFNLDIHIISLPVGLLSPDEFAARMQKGRRIIRQQLGEQDQSVQDT